MLCATFGVRLPAPFSLFVRLARHFGDRAITVRCGHGATREPRPGDSASERMGLDTVRNLDLNFNPPLLGATPVRRAGECAMSVGHMSSGHRLVGEKRYIEQRKRIEYYMQMHPVLLYHERNQIYL